MQIIRLDPREQDSRILLHLADIRCADGIQITYSLKRNGWIMSKRADTQQAIADDIWHEVAFVPGDDEE